MRPQPPHDEQALLQNLANGDERAFRTLFDRYSDLLGTYVLRVTKSYEVAEEVVQDVFLKIWQKREMLTEIHDFRSYLFIMSRNHALNYLKKAAGMTLSKEETDWNILENIPAFDPEKDIDYEDLIDEAINQLPPQQQKVYLLSRYERLSYLEIASRLDLSKETVKKYLQLATQSVTAYIRKGILIPLFLIFS